MDISIKDRYGKAYKTLLPTPGIFCHFLRNPVEEDLAQNLQPDTIAAKEL
ncbi:MAG: hypothetical protein AAF975_02970 [Spirochaetota bacterium]